MKKKSPKLYLKNSKKNQSKKEDCNHNWVLDGHNCGEAICSKCYKRPQ
jgi:hypothetical protein